MNREVQVGTSGVLGADGAVSSERPVISGGSLNSERAEGLLRSDGATSSDGLVRLEGAVIPAGSEGSEGPVSADGHDFPLAALVGQEQLKTALLLCAVNPGIGGVLIRGDKGSAKSTAARGLAGVRAPIERVIGCHYNCAPGEPAPSCEICNGS